MEQFTCNRFPQEDNGVLLSTKSAKFLYIICQTTGSLLIVVWKANHNRFRTIQLCYDVLDNPLSQSIVRKSFKHRFVKCISNNELWLTAILKLFRPHFLFNSYCSAPLETTASYIMLFERLTTTVLGQYCYFMLSYTTVLGKYCKELFQTMVCDSILILSYVNCHLNAL